METCLYKVDHWVALILFLLLICLLYYKGVGRVGRMKNSSDVNCFMVCLVSYCNCIFVVLKICYKIVKT